jgi:hypothetical protein
MYEYKVGDLAQMLAGVVAVERNLVAAEELGTEKPDAEYCDKLSICIDGLAICCSNFDADPSLIDQMRKLENELKSGTADTRCTVLRVRLKGIIDGVHNNLDSRQVHVYPTRRCTLFEQRQPLWC